jgi:outer membrane protein assembly factor BamA
VLEDDRRQVLAALGAAGYLHGDVETHVTPIGAGETGDVALLFVVRPGPRALFEGVFVRGNFRSEAALVDEALQLEPGDPLDLVAVGRARRRLRNLGIFTSVELRPAGPARSNGETWLLAAVQERTARSADAVVSFATDELFGVGADYLDVNLLGRAVRLSVQLRLSNASEPFGRGCGGPPDAGAATGVDLRCGRIGNRDLAQLVTHTPRPGGLPFDVETTTLYDYQDKPVYRERRLGQTLSLVHTFEAPVFTLGLGYELVTAYFYAREVTATRPLGLPSATIGRIVPRLGLERRDSFTDPHHGWKLDLRLEVAHAALAGPLPDGASFVRVILSGSVFVQLVRGDSELRESAMFFGGPLVLALAAGVGLAEPWAGAKDIPASEAYYYGGDQSVRGIPERASALGVPGARYLATGSAELRWYILQRLGLGPFQLAPFVDVGAVSSVPSALAGNLTVSLGAALRYVTPVGPLSLAWARPVRRPASIPGMGRFHFSFGYTF